MFLALDSANESQYFEIAVTQAKRKEKLFEAKSRNRRFMNSIKIKTHE